MACAEGEQARQMAVHPSDVAHLRDEFQRVIPVVRRRMRISHQETPYPDDSHRDHEEGAPYHHVFRTSYYREGLQGQHRTDHRAQPRAVMDAEKDTKTAVLPHRKTSVQDLRRQTEILLHRRFQT